MSAPKITTFDTPASDKTAAEKSTPYVDSPQFKNLYTDQMKRLQEGRLINPTPLLLQVEERVAHYYALLRFYERSGKSQSDGSTYKTFLLAHQRYAELYLSMQTDEINPHSIKEAVFDRLAPIIQNVLAEHPQLLAELISQITHMEV